MRAIRYYGFGGPSQLDEIDPPTPGAHEVVIDIHASQVAGDVLKVLAGSGPVRNAESFVFPHIPGYRGAGVVRAVGRDVRDLEVGDRVVVNGFVNCGECENCRRGLDNLCRHAVMLGLDSEALGAHAEQMKAPAWATFALPDNVSFAQATLIPNMALLVHAFERAAVSGEFSTAIFGCGFVGSAAISVAKAYGASRIVAVDKEPTALALAERCGATDILESGADETVADRVAGGVDVAVEIVGISETVEQAVLGTRSRGTALLIGALGGLSVSFPDYYRDVIQREVDIKPCFGKTQGDFTRAVDLVRSGALDLSPYTFREYSLEDFPRALESAGHGANTDLHIINPC